MRCQELQPDSHGMILETLMIINPPGRCRDHEKLVGFGGLRTQPPRPLCMIEVDGVKYKELGFVVPQSWNVLLELMFQETDLSRWVVDDDGPDAGEPCNLSGHSGSAGSSRAINHNEVPAACKCVQSDSDRRDV